MRKKAQNNSGSTYWMALLISAPILIIAVYFGMSYVLAVSYDAHSPQAAKVAAVVDSTTAVAPPPEPEKVAHMAPPTAVKALYMTSWIAGRKDLRGKQVIDLIDTTELNSVVIDIKDYTGKISYAVEDSTLAATGAVDSPIRVPDMKEFIKELHGKGIYVIGRIATFQDPYIVKIHPEWAVKRASDGGLWKDYKGIPWIDAGATGNWDYLVSIAKDAYNTGFDEVNYDYIRFPSDGNMKDISYPFSEGKSKPEVLKSFFKYLYDHLKTDNFSSDKGTGPYISADLFGLTTTSKDDLGIGQVLENALMYVDYVYPMVYPSHYPSGWNGYKGAGNLPDNHPYDVIKIAMTSAVKRAEALKVATTTPEALRDHISPLQLRPWIQDFTLNHVTYTAEMVRQEFQATYDSGLTSWLVWNASNHYSTAAFKAE